MTRTQYLAALKTLGLTPASKRTAEALGVKLRQCQNYADGTTSIPKTVAKLITLMMAVKGYEWFPDKLP